MAFCPHCGSPCDPDWTWCLDCGDKLPEPAEDMPRLTPLTPLPPEPPPEPESGPTELIVLSPSPSGPRRSPGRGRTAPRMPVAPPVLPPSQPAEPVPTIEPLPAREAPVDAHAELTLTARYEYTSMPGYDPPTLGLMLEIEAFGSPLLATGTGPVAHVIIALDLSASMDRPDKYPVLQGAVAAMLEDLQAKTAPEVLVSIVVFSRGSERLVLAVPAKEIDQAALFRAMDSSGLLFRDYTDLPGAMGRAGRIAYDQARANRLLPIRFYLLTDGRPQDLARSHEVADRLSRVKADVHALAFGGNADVVLLQNLFAGMRGGTVKSVRAETIGSAFERVAELAQQVVATRCEVAVDLAPGVVGGDAFRYRPGRVRFPQPAFEAGKRFRTDLGTIETDRRYSLVLEVRPPEADEPVTQLGAARVRIPGFGGPIEERIVFSIARTPGVGEPGDLDTGVRTARDILTALTSEDPQTALRALRLRRNLYAQERRDPGLLAVLDKAIHLLDRTGSLDGLSPGEHATLLAHTCTSGSEADGRR